MGTIGFSKIMSARFIEKIIGAVIVVIKFLQLAFLKINALN